MQSIPLYFVVHFLLQVSAPTLACVAFTVLDVFGFAYFMGLAIEIVTSIILILSVGLAIDYCVHISVAFMCYVVSDLMCDSLINHKYNGINKKLSKDSCLANLLELTCILGRFQGRESEEDTC